jgi:hypothetical protein
MGEHLVIGYRIIIAVGDDRSGGAGTAWFIEGKVDCEKLECKTDRSMTAIG